MLAVADYLDTKMAHFEDPEYLRLKQLYPWLKFDQADLGFYGSEQDTNRRYGDEGSEFGPYNPYDDIRRANAEYGTRMGDNGYRVRGQLPSFEERYRSSLGLSEFAPINDRDLANEYDYMNLWESLDPASRAQLQQEHEAANANNFRQGAITTSLMMAPMAYGIATGAAGAGGAAATGGAVSNVAMDALPGWLAAGGTPEAFAAATGLSLAEVSAAATTLASTGALPAAGSTLSQITNLAGKGVPLASSLANLNGGGGPGSGDDGVKGKTNEPPAYLKPYLERYLSRMEGHSKADPNQTFVPWNQEQEDAYSMIANRAYEGSPEYYAGSDQLVDTQEGRYFTESEMNPYMDNRYLDQVIGDTANDMADAYRKGTAVQTDASAIMGRTYGNSAYNEIVQDNQKTFADSLGKMAGQLRYGNFNDQRNLYDNYINRNDNLWNAERGRQTGTLGNIPGMINAGYEDANYLSQAGAGRRNYEVDRSREGERLTGLLGTAISNGGMSGGTTTVDREKPNPWAQGLGLLGMGLNLYNNWNK